MQFAGRVSRTASRLSAALSTKATVPSSRRAFSVVARNARGMARAQRPAAAAFPIVNHIRGMKKLNFGGDHETVIERSDYPKEKLQQIFASDTIAVIGYGVQGRAQSLNMKDNGLNPIIGVRKGGDSWKLAQEDGWVEGESLFDISEAAEKGTLVMYLLSDAAQKSQWHLVEPHLTKGKTLYFSHGFSVVFHDQTGVKPPADVDVILCAPKGSGTTVRRLFQQGKGINSSFAVYQNPSGKAEERAKALGVAIGSGYLYETTFEREVLSDLTGERGVLMGAIQGLFQAQYEVLRAKGHSPSEAFNETVEEATQSLYPLIGEKGMDFMYANCSATAQRGALDWYPEFYKATKPVFEKLYESVETGAETSRTLESTGKANYKTTLQKELDVLEESEMWQAGRTVRMLRPENQ
eukprot:Nk52_evm3s376 gene=Nk52_evmTU3s376